MATIKILPCDCKHEYQDAKYRVGMRGHNLQDGKQPYGKVYGCTVCDKTKDTSPK